MPLMQRAHRRDKANAFAGSTRFFAHGCDFCGGSKNEHGGNQQLAISN
jgi:hypothetical protein